MAIGQGSKVRVIQPVIEGVVQKLETNGSEFGFVVRYVDADGLEQERFFPQSVLQEVGV